MKTVLRILSFLFFPVLLSAQTSIIRGTVVDQQSETPLVGATVQLIQGSLTVLNPNPSPEREGSLPSTGSAPLPLGGGAGGGVNAGGGAGPIGAMTDADGAFVLSGVPVGRQVIRVSYLGYEPVTVPNILVTAGKEVQLELHLEESLSTLNEVVVTAAADKDKPVNDLATISARQFNTEEVQRFSGGSNDISRLVTNFAGVAAANDSRNDIVIRGNSPVGVLWRLEGVPIPSPNHFATLGTTGGPVSAMNPNMIRNSDFLTPAFSADSGNHNAFLFVIGLCQRNHERYEITAELAAFSGLEDIAVGPLNN